VTHTGCLLATSDNEIGKIDLSPSGCGENRAILHSRPRWWTGHGIRARLRLHPTDKVRGDPGSVPILTRNAARGKVNNRL
jgi:hypothetical protein